MDDPDQWRDPHRDREDLKLARMMILNGADVNRRIPNKDTALHIAARYKLRTVKFLLEHGASLSLKNSNGRNALHMVCFGDGSYDIYKELLDHGTDCINDRDENGATPLLLVLAFGRNSKNCQLLLNHGADLNVVDTCGRGALHYAARNPRAGMVRFVMNLGFDVDCSDDDVQPCMRQQ